MSYKKEQIERSINKLERKLAYWNIPGLSEKQRRVADIELFRAAWSVVYKYKKAKRSETSADE